MQAATAQNLFQQAEAPCVTNQSASASYSVVSAGGSITGIGNFYHRADTVASIHGGFGNIILFGVGGISKVETIGDFTGNITLCQMELGSLNGLPAGNVFVGGNVGPISNSTGNIYFYSDQFPAISKFVGNVIIKTNAGQVIGRSYSVQ